MCAERYVYHASPVGVLDTFEKKNKKNSEFFHRATLQGRIKKYRKFSLVRFRLDVLGGVKTSVLSNPR